MPHKNSRGIPYTLDSLSLYHKHCQTDQDSGTESPSHTTRHSTRHTGRRTSASVTIVRCRGIRQKCRRQEESSLYKCQPQIILDPFARVAQSVRSPSTRRSAMSTHARTQHEHGQTHRTTPSARRSFRQSTSELTVTGLECVRWRSSLDTKHNLFAKHYAGFELSF